jgi:hypothetical protein
LADLPEKSPNPDDEFQREQSSFAALDARRADLDLQSPALLADLELQRISLLADLVHFQKRYLQTVGSRYALLDELKAKVAEALAKKNPHNDDARYEARKARAKAQESATALGDEKPEALSQKGTDVTTQPNRSDRLRRLYLLAATLYHHDLMIEPNGNAKRLELLVKVDEAFTKGDEERIRAILREWPASPESVQGDDPDAVFFRSVRRLAHNISGLKALSVEIDQLRQGELFKLKQMVEEAHEDGRYLLKELGDKLDRDIVESRNELKRATSMGQP